MPGKCTGTELWHFPMCAKGWPPGFQGNRRISGGVFFSQTTQGGSEQKPVEMGVMFVTPQNLLSEAGDSLWALVGLFLSTPSHIMFECTQRAFE